MSRNHSSKSKKTSHINHQNNSSYQSFYLWTSFLLGMISLGIVVWNRGQSSSVIQNNAVISSNAGDLLENSSVIPAQAGIQSLFSDLEFLDSRLHGNGNSISIYRINFPRTASSLALGITAYQLSGNSFIGLLSSSSLFFATPAAAQYSGLQTAIPEFRVNTYISGAQVYPYVKKLINGEFIIAWNSYDQDGSGCGVYAQRCSNNGTVIGNELRINNFTLADQCQTWIETLDTGSFVIVWNTFQQYGEGYGIYGRVFNSNAAALTNEFLINMYTAGRQVTPYVFANVANEFLVLWSSLGQDGSGLGIYGRYFFNNGTVRSSEFQVNNYTDGIQHAAVGTALSSNRWVIAWHSEGQDGSSFGIYAKIYTNHTATLGPEFRVNQFTQNAQVAPTVIHFQDEFIIVFLSQGQGPVAVDDQNNYSVYGRRFADDGTALGDQFRISFLTSSNYHRSSAVILKNDYYIVVWKAYSNMMGKLDIYGRICHREGGCISQEFRINSKYISINGTVDWTGEQIAVLNDQNFVVTYEILAADPDDSDGVYARIISLKDLNITLPAQSVSTVVATTLAALTSASTSAINAQESPITTGSTTMIDLTESASTEMPVNGNNTGVLVGGIASAFATGVLITAAGFFAVSKCKKSKSSAQSNNNEVPLQNKSAQVPSSNRNYGEIDAMKKDSHQYDRPVELKI